MLYVNKSTKKHIFSGSGTGGREFESRHFDQKSAENEPFLTCFRFFSIHFEQNDDFGVTTCLTTCKNKSFVV